MVLIMDLNHSDPQSTHWSLWFPGGKSAHEIFTNNYERFTALPFQGSHCTSVPRHNFPGCAVNCFLNDGRWPNELLSCKYFITPILPLH